MDEREGRADAAELDQQIREAQRNNQDAEDLVHVAADEGGGRSRHLQKELHALAGAVRLRELLCKLENNGLEARLRQIHYLMTKDANHLWLWNVSAQRGRVL